MDIISAADIEKISDNAWKSMVADSLKPCEQSYDTSKTIRVINSEAHQAYASFKMFDKVEKPKETSEDSEDSSESDSEAIHFARPVPIRMRPSEFYKKFVDRTPEECANELAAPQKSEAWLSARKYSITASQFGSAVGSSPYQTPDQLLVDKLWNTFQGNAATRWGNDHENDAKSAFCEWFTKYLATKGGSDFEFMEENLMKYSSEPWMAVSPDGIIRYKIDGKEHIDLVEFKCPAYLRNTVQHPYAKFDNIPPHYMAQIQGVMGYLNNNHPTFNITQCWFVVWQPMQTWITLQQFDVQYYDDMHTKLKTWYFNSLLPALTHKHNGLLAFGETSPQDIISMPE